MIFVLCLNSFVLLQPKAAAGATQPSNATSTVGSTTAAPTAVAAPIPVPAPVPAPVPPPPAPDAVACEPAPVSAPKEEKPEEKPPEAPAAVSPSSIDRYGQASKNGFLFLLLLVLILSFYYGVRPITLSILFDFSFFLTVISVSDSSMILLTVRSTLLAYAFSCGKCGLGNKPVEGRVK